MMLDPMFGSGTTILEAVHLHRNATGCDIDPLARLIAEAKLSRLNLLLALQLGGTVAEKARRSFAEQRDRLEAAQAATGIPRDHLSELIFQELPAGESRTKS